MTIVLLSLSGKQISPFCAVMAYRQGLWYLWPALCQKAGLRKYPKPKKSVALGPERIWQILHPDRLTGCRFMYTPRKHSCALI